MVKFNIKDDYFDYVKRHPDRPVIVYGVTKPAIQYSAYIGNIDFFCDEKASDIGMIGDVPCILPQELETLQKDLIIINCMKNVDISGKVYPFLSALNINAELFHLYNNPAFLFYDQSSFTYALQPKDRLKINIVCSQDGWILSKFAVRLQEELKKLEQEVSISEKEDLKADINHYVHFERLTLQTAICETVRTTMITHVDCQFLANLVKYQARNNVMGICMSSDTMNKLLLWGVPRDKLCYINPAHDGDMKPKKTVLGITNRCYYEYDLRKRDDLMLQVCKQLEPGLFQLKIMGSGWDKVVAQMRKIGFEVEYDADFDRERYKELMASLDYWIFTGFDEGGMGYLDALAAGVKTIVTPQGFHLDTKCGLTFPCSTIEDFVRVLKQIQNEKKEIMNAVKEWTWENYAKKHLEVWQYLTCSKSLKELYVHQGEYMDGIFSMNICNNRLI